VPLPFPVPRPSSYVSVSLPLLSSHFILSVAALLCPIIHLVRKHSPKSAATNRSISIRNLVENLLCPTYSYRTIRRQTVGKNCPKRDFLFALGAKVPKSAMFLRTLEGSNKVFGAWLTKLIRFCVKHLAAVHQISAANLSRSTPWSL